MALHTVVVSVAMFDMTEYCNGSRQQLLMATVTTVHVVVTTFHIIFLHGGHTTSLNKSDQATSTCEIKSGEMLHVQAVHFVTPAHAFRNWGYSN